MVGFNPESGMPVKRTRGPDRQQRVRRCGRCKGVPDLATKYPYIDPSKCGGIGGGMGGGKKKCDYFDEEGVRRCRRCEQGSGGNQYNCAATRGKPDECEYFNENGNRK
jgi:hypothetical protein